MNEDKRYDAFPYIRGDNIVKLVGGPLHNQYFNWRGYLGFREVRIAWCDPLDFRLMQYTEDASAYAPDPMKVLEYRLFRETFWVMAHGVVRLYGAYFTGFH